MTNQAIRIKELGSLFTETLNIKWQTEINKRKTLLLVSKKAKEKRESLSGLEN